MIFRALLVTGLLWTLGLQVVYGQDPRDCNGALPICSELTTQSTPVIGEGANPNDIPFANPNTCIIQERNGRWYEIETSLGGNFEFLIEPLGGALIDMDYVLYDVTGNVSCDEIALGTNLPINCNSCDNLINPGPNFSFSSTGLNPVGPASVSSQLPIAGCTRYNRNIILPPNRRLLLYVSSFTNPPTAGYTLNFAGTAPGVLNFSTPRVTSVSTSCGTDTLRINFNKPIDCALLQPGQIQVVTPNGVVLNGQQIFGCNGGRARSLRVRLNGIINVQDTYTVSVLPPLSDLCGNNLQTTQVRFAPPGSLRANAGSNVVYCEGAPGIQLNGSGSGGTGTYVYQWSPNVFISNPNIANPIVNPPVATKYYLQVSSGGCVSRRDSLVVTYQPRPVATLVGPTTVCAGTQVNVAAQGSQAAIWLPGGFTATNVNFVALTDTVITAIPLSNGCQGDPVTYNLNVTPGPSSTFTHPLTACTFDPVTIQYAGPIPPGTQFSWNFDGGIVLSGAGGGPYSVFWPFDGTKNIILTVQAANTCTSTTIRSIQVGPRPALDAGPDRSICRFGSVRLLGQSSIATGCSYNWTPTTGLDNPTSLQPLASPSATTTYFLTASCAGCSGTTDSVRVIVRPFPQAIVPTTPVVHCLGSGGVPLPGSGSGGTGRLEYRWTPTTGLNNPFVSTPLANPSQTTEYTLLVTDSAGCVSDSAKLTVWVQNRPRVNAGPELTLCTNGAGDTLRATVLTGQAPGSLIWSWTPSTGLNNATLPAPVANPTVTTIYTVRVTDPLTGCTNSTSDPEASVLVRRSTRPIANAGPDRAICLGDSAQLGDFGQNLGVNVRYAWSPALGLSDTTAQFPKASPPISTRYFLRIISDGCESVTDEVRVEVVSSPTVVINQNIQEVCPGESTQLTTQIVNGRPPYTYTWWPTAGLSDPTSASPLARPTVTTWYKVRATATACVNPAVDSVLVQVAPSLILEADSTNSIGGLILCQGESLQIPARVISAFPAPVTWTPTTGLSNPNVLRPIANPTITTAYIVSTTLGRCDFRDTVTITVVPNIVAGVSADSTRLCEGQTTLLRATGGIGSATYRWSPTTGLNRATGAIVRARPTQTTLYTVTASEGGCEDTASVLVEVFRNVTSRFRQSYARGCDSTLLVTFEDLSTGATAWLWDFGDGTTPSNSRNPLHLYESPGVYYPRLRAFANPVCSDVFVSPTPVIVTEGPVARFSSQPPLDTLLRLPIAELRLQDESEPGVVNWFWQFGDGTVSREQNPVKRYNAIGDFYITLFATDSVGCTDSIVRGPFRVRESWLDIPNVFTPNGDGINDRWLVPYNGPERYRLAVLDRWGQTVHTANSPNQPWDGRLGNGENAADGVYYYVLEIGSKLYKGSLTLIR